jgi:hypothetical protein
MFFDSSTEYFHSLSGVETHPAMLQRCVTLERGNNVNDGFVATGLFRLQLPNLKMQDYPRTYDGYRGRDGYQ